MEQFRRVLSLIQTQLSKLSVTHKLLMVSLAVVMLMTLFVVSQYAGGSQMEELWPGSTPDQQKRAVEVLQSGAIKHEMREGRLFVPVDKRYFVLAQISQKGGLPDDTSVLFSNLADKTSWTMSPEQSRGMQVMALQNELGRVITQFAGIRDARVFIDAPAPKGLGQSVRLPTATATVFTEGGRPLTQDTVDAIAHLIASSKSGLSPGDVRVIDGSSNRQHRARSEDDMVAATYYEYSARVETRVREKLLDMLAYVDGVVVAVNARVDVRKKVSESQKFMPSGQGTVTAPKKETVSERTETGTTSAGEAGVRPNTGADIARGGGQRTSSTDTQNDSELDTKFGHESVQITDPRGMPTKINATINIPRSYFVRRWKSNQGANAPANDPADTDLAPVVQSETERIKSDVSPLLETAVDEQVTAGVVQVSMIPDSAPGASGAGAGGSGVSGASVLGGGLNFLASGMVKTAALSAMAIVALGMMAMALKKSSRPAKLPSAQELVGVPPALAGDGDMVGEADEADAALAGIEMSDDDLQRRKKVEQVTALVKEKPADAARLLGRWISQEE